MAELARYTTHGLDVVALTQADTTKYFITAHPDPRAGTFDVFPTLARFLRTHKAVVVAQDVFGPCRLHANGAVALRMALPNRQWPVTWIEGDRGETQHLTGTQVYAVSDAATNVHPVVLDGRVVGVVHDNHDATYCLLGDIRCLDTGLTREAQARVTWEMLEAALAQAGLTFADVVRTWLYVDRILEWYGPFNKVRDVFFRERRVFEGRVPASTGVGVANPAGAAIVADAFAIRPKRADMHIFPVPSPLQCPALDYGSTFSRAVEVAMPGLRRLYISGTASIEPGGLTAHVGDVRKQIELTMAVVNGILESRGMGWGDICRAVAYLRNMDSAPEFASYCADHGLPAFPCAVAHADICRDDLLFELEADAMTTREA